MMLKKPVLFIEGPNQDYPLLTREQRPAHRASSGYLRLSFILQ